MRGLSPTLDLAPLVGGSVMQICIGANQLQIHLDNRISLMVESECIYRESGVGEMHVDRYAASATTLCSLIDQSVTLAVRTSNGGLALTFNSGAVLEALNDSSRYESFQLHIGFEVHVA